MATHLLHVVSDVHGVSEGKNQEYSCLMADCLRVHTQLWLGGTRLQCLLCVAVSAAFLEITMFPLYLPWWDLLY